jgi:hypothetical protein
MSDVSHLSAADGQGADLEVQMLPRLLDAGEQIIDVCHGKTEGRPAVLVATDRRVLYMQRRRLWGSDVASTPLTRVRSAEDHLESPDATVVIDAGACVFELCEVDRARAQMFCARLRAQLAAQ